MPRAAPARAMASPGVVARSLAPLSRRLCASAAVAEPVYDVLVVGGGVVGSLLAALLRCAPRAALQPCSPDSAPRPQRRAADSRAARGCGGPVAAERRAAGAGRAVRAMQHAHSRQRACARRCGRLARRGGRARHRLVRRDAGVGRRRRWPRALHGGRGGARRAWPRCGKRRPLRRSCGGAAAGWRRCTTRARHAARAAPAAATASWRGRGGGGGAAGCRRRLGTRAAGASWLAARAPGSGC